jgi:hypothetical protein
MNINYQELITAVNKRKDALQEFERLVILAPDMAECLSSIAQFATELHAATEALDPEALKMLPVGLIAKVKHCRLQELSQRYYCAVSASNYQESGLKCLAEFIDRGSK